MKGNPAGFIAEPVFSACGTSYSANCVNQGTPSRSISRTSPGCQPLLGRAALPRPRTSGDLLIRAPAVLQPAVDMPAVRVVMRPVNDAPFDRPPVGAGAWHLLGTQRRQTERSAQVDNLSHLRGNISSKRLEKRKPSSFHIARGISRLPTEELHHDAASLANPRPAPYRCSRIRGPTPQHTHNPTD